MKSALGKDDEGQELGGEFVAGGGVQSVADVDHALPFGDGHEALHCEANQACMQRDLELIDGLKPFGSLGALLLWLLLLDLVLLVLGGLGPTVDAAPWSIKFESDRLGCKVLVERRLLVLDFIDAAPGNFPEAASFLEVLDEANAALSDQEDVVPAVSFRELERIRQIVGKDVPGIPDNAHKL